jgi:hypothetical protein
MSTELELLRQHISELETKNAKLEAEKAEIEARNVELLKQVMDENAKRDARVEELELKNTELEARLLMLEQGSSVVDGQSQNDRETIAEISADSVIDQQNDANTKSIEDKEIGDFIPEEPANVSDSVIVQPKQCKPPQIEEVTTKVNHQGRSLDDMKTDAFLDEEYKKKVSDEIRQRKREKKLQGELIVQESSPAINTSCITDLSMTSTELVTLPEQVVKESIPKESTAESAIPCELKPSGPGNKQNTPPKKIPYNQKVEQDLICELLEFIRTSCQAFNWSHITNDETVSYLSYIFFIVMFCMICIYFSLYFMYFQ